MRSFLLLLLVACAAPSAPDTPPVDPAVDPVDLVETFRAARKEGDHARVASLLTEDPRIWYGEHEGEGSPWNPARPGQGRWSGWDDHFEGVSERVTPWTVAGNTVHADMYETNEYYELTERGGGSWRATYFLEGGRIAGFMVSPVVSPVPGVETPEGRGDEFEAWAREHHPEEAEYLMPGGSIDPTGDRPVRMRALLNTWRVEVGLEPIE